MRRNVVLPQPLAPTMQMNSPSSIWRLMFRRASTSPPVALMKVFDRSRVSSFGILLVPQLEVAPGGHPLLDQREQLHAEIAANGQHEDADEETGGVEHLGGRQDEEAEPRLRAKQLGHHHADEGARDAQPQPRDDERERGGEQHLAEDLRAAGAEGARRLNEVR